MNVLDASAVLALNDVETEILRSRDNVVKRSQMGGRATSVRLGPEGAAVDPV